MAQWILNRPPECCNSTEHRAAELLSRLPDDWLIRWGFHSKDHDTGGEGFGTDWTGPGWWGVYWKLLHDGCQAPVALFFDPAQRPWFRNRTAFQPEKLRRSLKDRPVQARLVRTVRYTRPIFDFLQSLEGEGAVELAAGLMDHPDLPDGPPVEVVQAAHDQVPDRVAALAERWVEEGWCQAGEILILSRHGNWAKSALAGHRLIGGFPLVEYLRSKPGHLSRCSVNKAKGLDAVGVILIDFGPYETIEDPGHRAGFFLGASRARLLLGVVGTKPNKFFKQ